MTRLAVPILILLLMLFAGVGWLLVVKLNAPDATAPSISQQQSPASGDKASSESSSAEAAKADANASFDVARIDPQGTSVFAGQAEPGATVTILGDGQPIGSAEADENGEWTFATEHPFASADPKLALTVKSAAETKAEKAAQTKVAGSLETREAAKEEPKGKKTAGTVATDLLKNFEGIVAAARDEAKQEKKEAAENPAGAKSEVQTGEAKTEDKPAPASTQKPEEKMVAVAEPPQPQPQPPPAVAPAVAPSAPPPPAASSAPDASDTPAEKSAAPPSAEPSTRLAATAPETPPTPSSKSIPVPITFVFNEATFTDEGRKAAELLLEYLQIKHFARVELTGHADERGTEALNMDLSKERLDAVQEFLKHGGFNGKLKLIPKGETEPFSGVDRTQYDKEDLYQLDRRVELITTP